MRVEDMTITVEANADSAFSGLRRAVKAAIINHLAAPYRAEQLLREHLTPDQWASWQNRDEFEVIVTRAGHPRRFVVPRRGVVREYDNRNTHIVNYCLVSAEDGIPDPDVALARKTMLECDFTGFMEKANSLPQIPLIQYSTGIDGGNSGMGLFATAARQTAEELTRRLRNGGTSLRPDFPFPLPDQYAPTRQEQNTGGYVLDENVAQALMQMWPATPVTTRVRRVAVILPGPPGSAQESETSGAHRLR